jgi:hypothetical protein
MNEATICEPVRVCKLYVFSQLHLVDVSQQQKVGTPVFAYLEVKLSP